MVKIKFDSGQTVEFDGDPTPQDIEQVAKEIAIANKHTEVNTQMKSKDFQAMEPLEQENWVLKGLADTAGEIGRAAARVPGVYAKSGGKLLGNLFQAATHPVDTLIAAGKAALRPVDTVREYAKGRYDSPENIMKTLNEDPIGAVADFSGVGTGLGAGLSAVGKANNLGKVAQAGTALQGAGMVPLQAAGKMASPVTNILKNRANALFDKMEGMPLDLSPVIAKNADEFRKLINPGKGEIKNIEVVSGKKMSDFFELAAKEKLIINKSVDGKLDTTLARESLMENADAFEAKLDEFLKSDPAKKFDLPSLSKKVKRKLRDDIHNDDDYLTAVGELDRQLTAAVEQRGEMVNALELNNIKRGMWRKGYDQLRPSSNQVARAIGFVAKEAIEDAYPSGAIGLINQRLGKYYTLNTLLENAQGRVVNRGKIGKYGAELTGALALEKIPVLGPLVGKAVGGAINDFMTNPERITTAMAKKLKKYPGDPLVLPKDKTPLGELKLRERTGPKALPYKKPITRKDRLLPSPKKAGQSSGPTIAQGTDIEKQLERLALPYKKASGKGFTMEDVPDKIGHLIRQTRKRSE